jgi:hypothetical protein
VFIPYSVPDEVPYDSVNCGRSGVLSVFLRSAELRNYMEQHILEADSNASTVVVRVVKCDKRGNPFPWGYNWATLFQGEENIGTRSSMLEESQNGDSEIW